MTLLPSSRSNLFGLALLCLFSVVPEGIAENNGIRDNRASSGGFFSSFLLPDGYEWGFRDRQGQRELGHHKSLYYEFLDGDDRVNTQTSLSDVWLCLACALGWSIWLVSTQQPPQELVFEQLDSAKAMGHVLQVSLGEDILGTGIPVYYALIDYVVTGDRDEDHIQVRKVFTSKNLIEEGFANVEVLYLTEDPTTAMLVEELREQQKDRENQSPPSTIGTVVICFLSFVLILLSLFGGFRMASRLETPLYGWISLGIGLVLLYPAAKLFYRFLMHLYSLAGPLAERPGVIVHGKRLYWAKQCHGTLNPMELLGVNDRKLDRLEELSHLKSDRSIELSELSLPRLGGEDPERVRTKRRDPMTTPKMFPNAGCGFGNFNVHLPVGTRRTNSSVSSMSASASQASEKVSTVPVITPVITPAFTQIVRNDTSILEKYEQHVSAVEKRNGPRI